MSVVTTFMVSEYHSQILFILLRNMFFGEGYRGRRVLGEKYQSEISVSVQYVKAHFQ